MREATEDDVPAILEIFDRVYGGDYPYRRFKDAAWLKRSVFIDDILMLVAEDEGGGIVGTASVVFDVGAHSDLIGEFGRLAVDAAGRGRGAGSRLMDRRVELSSSRLHVAVVENRCVHPYSQRISQSHGFVPVGFLPMKHLFGRRESIALFVRHFGPALGLRRNHPRVVPEAHALAHVALGNCGLPLDVIVDETSAAYPQSDAFVVEDLSADGLPSLLRIERGRVRNREVYGHMRLQYGFFKLQAKQATYLIAREGGDCAPVAGAIGYTRDDVEKGMRIFELIARSDDAVRFLLEQLLNRCTEWGTEYVEVDVSAHAPRMQRTLVELGFVPVAYVPAMVFADVERLDVVRMARLLVQPDVGDVQLVPGAQRIADLVMNALTRQAVLPEVEEAIGSLSLFDGLNREQATRVAGTCAVERRAQGQTLFESGSPAEEMFLLIEGGVRVERTDGRRVGAVAAGGLVGERALLTGEAHTATATAEVDVVAAVLSRNDLAELTRLRPDVGLVLYRNLAVALGRKLRDLGPRS